MFECPPEMSFEECLKRQLKANQSTSMAVSKTPHTNSPSHQKPLIMKSGHSIGGGGFTHSYSSPSLNKSHYIGHGGSSGGGGFNMSFGKSDAYVLSGVGFSNSGSSNNSLATSKGGIVVNQQTVIVKSNFEMAGRLNKDGKRNSAKTLGSHASASLNYMENHGARDLEQNEELSNIYDANGERLSKEEFDELKKQLNEGVGAFRRIVIDVGHNELERDDMNRLVRESLQEFQEKSGKQFDYVYGIHTDTDHIHAHVLSYGKSHEINMTKEHLQLFKQTIGIKTDELLQEHKLENDRDLSLHQQIDKSIDGVLDNQQTKTQSLSL